MNYNFGLSSYIRNRLHNILLSLEADYSIYFCSTFIATDFYILLNGK